MFQTELTLFRRGHLTNILSKWSGLRDFKVTFSFSKWNCIFLSSQSCDSSEFSCLLQTIGNWSIARKQDLRFRKLNSILIRKGRFNVESIVGKRWSTTINRAEKFTKVRDDLWLVKGAAGISISTSSRVWLEVYLHDRAHQISVGGGDTTRLMKFSNLFHLPSLVPETTLNSRLKRPIEARENR